MPSFIVLTIGHSTRNLDEFIKILQAYGVTKVLDIRTVPRSRRNPQFNGETLPEGLNSAGIGYMHMPALGGLRRPRKDSENTGWRNASFRGFADYMQTQEFEENIKKLIEHAARERVALMCAESLPWRCHRSLIADALLVRGIKVEHITGIQRRTEHRLTPFASVKGKQITYPPAGSGAAPEVI